MQRRSPKWLKPFEKSCNKLIEVAELVELAYKVFLEKYKNRKTGWLNLLKNNKYKSVIMKFIEQIGSLLADYDVEVNKAESMKLFCDYFIALDSYHIEKGHSGFFFNQIAGMYAIEVFLSWIENNYGSIDRYFDVGLEKKEVRLKRQQEREQMEDKEIDSKEVMEKIARVKTVREIKGLVEIEF